MDASQTYILIGIIVLLIIGAIIFFVNKKKGKVKPITPLAGVAFAFILAGIAFGDTRLKAYGLMGIGVVIAIIDMIIKMKKK